MRTYLFNRNLEYTKSQIKSILTEIYSNTELISALAIDYIGGERLTEEADSILLVYYKALKHLRKRRDEIEEKLLAIMGDRIKVLEGRYVRVKKTPDGLKIAPVAHATHMEDAEPIPEEEKGN